MEIKNIVVTPSHPFREEIRELEAIQKRTKESWEKMIEAAQKALEKAQEMEGEKDDAESFGDFLIKIAMLCRLIEEQDAPQQRMR